jgi:hypothetical protein
MAADRHPSPEFKVLVFAASLRSSTIYVPSARPKLNAFHDTEHKYGIKGLSLYIGFSFSARGD